MKDNFESLSQFKRGQSSKKSLDIGYTNAMRRISDELNDALNLGSDIQYETNLSNHPDTPAKARGLNNPVYTITGGMEGGFGLPGLDTRIISFNIFVNPFDLAISGEISITDLAVEYEEDKYFEIRPREIKDAEIPTMTKEIREMTEELFIKANIEVELI